MYVCVCVCEGGKAGWLLMSPAAMERTSPSSSGRNRKILWRPCSTHGLDEKEGIVFFSLLHIYIKTTSQLSEWQGQKIAPVITPCLGRSRGHPSACPLSRGHAAGQPGATQEQGVSYSLCYNLVVPLHKGLLIPDFHEFHKTTLCSEVSFHNGMVWLLTSNGIVQL